MDFYDFNLHEDLVEGIDSMGYRTPTPIQQQAIPLIIEGKDLIACAQTGTGKTAAYLIPIIDRISHANYADARTTTLVLVPTRELAKQIDEQCEGFGYFASITSLAIYGGGKSENWEQQKRALTSGADIVIATPGRLMAHMQLGYVKFDQLEYLILDEADKMLDMGFSDDILQIVSQIPQNRQTLLFSATMPDKIRRFAQQILRSPEEIRLSVSKPAAGIDQRFYMVWDTLKLRLLQRLISDEDVQSMLLFTSRKLNVGPIEKALRQLGYNVRGITSDRSQEEREVVLREFKNKQFQILVATDVMSRGIDIDSLSHVVNFDLPREPEDYVHRIGRTARAAGTGTAITFVSDHDQDAVVKIERLIEREVEKRPTPEDIGSSPEFDPKKYRGKPRPGASSGFLGINSKSSSGDRGGSREGGSRNSGSRGSREGGRRDEAPRDSSTAAPAERAPREGGHRERPAGPPRERRPEAPRPIPTEGAADGEAALPAVPVAEAQRKKRRKKKRKPATATAQVGAEGQVTGAVAPAETMVEQPAGDEPQRRSRGGRGRRKPDAPTEAVGTTEGAD